MNVRYFFITNTNSKEFSYIMRIYWMNYCAPVPSREREKGKEKGGGEGAGMKRKKDKRKEA